MRRATIRTTHGDRRTAERVAAAVRPDNTDEMRTVVGTDTADASSDATADASSDGDDGAAVVTTIERDSTGGLHATVDDYVVNLHVAAQLTDQDGEPSTSHITTADTDTT